MPSSLSLFCFRLSSRIDVHEVKKCLMFIAVIHCSYFLGRGSRSPWTIAIFFGPASSSLDARLKLYRVLLFVTASMIIDAPLLPIELPVKSRKSKNLFTASTLAKCNAPFSRIRFLLLPAFCPEPMLKLIKEQFLWSDLAR